MGGSSPQVEGVLFVLCREGVAGSFCWVLFSCFVVFVFVAGFFFFFFFFFFCVFLFFFYFACFGHGGCGGFGGFILFFFFFSFCFWVLFLLVCVSAGVVCCFLFFFCLFVLGCPVLLVLTPPYEIPRLPLPLLASLVQTPLNASNQGISLGRLVFLIFGPGGQIEIRL